MKEKLYRTVLSVLIVVGCVMAVRWTIRAAMTRAYRADRDVGAAEVPVVPAPRIHVLAAIVPKELHVNIAGLAATRRAERMHMPYSLAVTIAEDRAKSANWERIDNENAITVKNLSGMDRLYRTPEGAIVLREVRPIKGDDSLMEDFILPTDAVPVHGDVLTPDMLARRSAHRLKGLMPAVLRDVVIGSPLMTELINRGGGSSLIVHCVADMPVKAAEEAVMKAAIKAGWVRTPFMDVPGGDRPAAAAIYGEKDAAAHAPKESWSKANLTFCYEVVTRAHGTGCDVNYRFTDDEVYIPTKGKANES